MSEKSYCKTIGLFGEKVEVEGGDLGTREPWIWIIINGGGIGKNHGQAVLGIEEACTIRDALDKAIDDAQVRLTQSSSGI